MARSTWIALSAGALLLAGCSVDTSGALCHADGDCPTDPLQVCVPSADGGLFGTCQPSSSAVTSSTSSAGSSGALAILPGQPRTVTLTARTSF